MRDEEEKYESVRERRRKERRKLEDIRSIAGEAGFDSLNEFIAYVEENRNLKKKNEELERRAAHLRRKSAGLASRISKRIGLIKQKESILGDLRKQISELRPLEEKLQRSVDRNSEVIKLALLVFAMADRGIGRWKEFGSDSPWGYRKITFEELKEEYGVDPYNWEELRDEIVRTAEGLIVSNPRLKSALFEAMSGELIREGMPSRPGEGPAEHVGRFREEIKKVLTKEN